MDGITLHVATCALQMTFYCLPHHFTDQCTSQPHLHHACGEACSA